jgi:hypothetical protein
MVTIYGNGRVRTIVITKHLSNNVKRLEMLLRCDFQNDIKCEDKDVIFITKLKLLSIGTINLFEEKNLLCAISITIKTTKYVVTNVTIKSIYIHPTTR